MQETFFGREPQEFLIISRGSDPFPVACRFLSGGLRKTGPCCTTKPLPWVREIASTIACGLLLTNDKFLDIIKRIPAKKKAKYSLV